MKGPCYEYSHDGVCLVWVACFFHKEVTCTSKTKIKDGVQYANKKIPGDIIIYTPRI